MAPAPRVNWRWPAAAAAVLIAAAAFRRFIGSDDTIALTAILYTRLSLVAWGGVVLTAALALGLRVLGWTALRPRDGGAAALFGLGAGLGVFSLLALALGSAGLTHRALLIALLALSLAAGIRPLAGLARAVAARIGRARTASRFHLLLWGVLALFAALHFLRAFTPLYDYDTLEYHAAAPAEYDRAGKVVFLRDNVYANFPQNSEMLTFLAMRLTGSPDSGAVIGKMLSGVFGLMTALALYRMLALVAGRSAGLLAAGFFLTWPKTTLYAGDLYVEPALLFYGTLALWGVVWSLRRRRSKPGARGWILLAGLAAGLAVGVKYTAALLVCAPLGAGVIAASLTRRTPLREAALRTALFAACALLAFAPWMIRNVVHTGNPVYPLLYPVFGGSPWSPEQDAAWMKAHSPPPSEGVSVKDRLARMGGEARELLFYNEGKASLLLVVFAPFCLLAGRRTRALWLWLAVYGAALFLLYYFFTQRNARFFDAAVPALAALSALGAGALLRARPARVLRPVLVALLLFEPVRLLNYGWIWQGAGVALGAQSAGDFFRQHAPGGFGPYEHMEYLNDPANVPPGARILFLGEAQTFYCRRDHVASTVFNRHLLEDALRDAPTPEVVRDRLRAAGITHLYVNTFELCRLQSTYRYQFGGRERLGMLEGFDWGLFGRFAAQHLRVVKTFSGPDPAAFRWSEWPRFLAAHERGQAERRLLAAHFTALYAVE